MRNTLTWFGPFITTHVKKWHVTVTVNDPILPSQTSTLDADRDNFTQVLRLVKDVHKNGWDIVSVSITLNKKED